VRSADLHTLERDLELMRITETSKAVVVLVMAGAKLNQVEDW